MGLYTSYTTYTNTFLPIVLYDDDPQANDKGLSKGAKWGCLSILFVAAACVLVILAYYGALSLHQKMAASQRRVRVWTREWRAAAATAPPPPETPAGQAAGDIEMGHGVNKPPRAAVGTGAFKPGPGSAASGRYWAIYRWGPGSWHWRNGNGGRNGDDQAKR